MMGGRRVRSGDRDSGIREGAAVSASRAKVTARTSMPAFGRAAALAKQAMPGLQGAFWPGAPLSWSQQSMPAWLAAAPFTCIGHGLAAIACADGAATSGKASTAVQTSSRVRSLIRRCPPVCSTCSKPGPSSTGRANSMQDDMTPRHRAGQDRPNRLAGGSGWSEPPFQFDHQAKLTVGVVPCRAGGEQVGRLDLDLGRQP